MSNHGYSRTSVDRAIASYNRSQSRFNGRIRKPEAKLIHAVLRGRQKEDEPHVE